MTLDPSKLVHVGYALMLCALVARDVLWLRSILVAAQSTLAAYAWFTDRPGMAAWNALFVVINAVWVLRLLQERRAVQLSPELRTIHERHFGAFATPEFLRFWNASQERIADGGVLVSAGESPPDLLYLLEGQARALRAGQPVAVLPAGSFIAEMSLVADTHATADVHAEGRVRLRAWPMESIRELRRRQPLLWSKLQAAIGHDLVEKLVRGNGPQGRVEP